MRTYSRTPVIDRVVAKLVEQDGHWLWTGSVGSSGYGKVTGEPSAPGLKAPDLLVHRVVWEHHNGPIPDGLVLDHTDACLVILCCNPEHLEPVTQAENRRRQHERRTTCAKGHPYTAENTRVGKNGRECRTCHADRERERRKRNAIKPCQHNARHWFAYYGWVGSSAPTCRHCGEPNPRYVRDRDPFAGEAGAARHALFAAVRDGGVPDPLSKGARS